MKLTLFLAGAILALTGCIYVGDSDLDDLDDDEAVRTSAQIPQNVQNALLAKYPGASATWEIQPYGYEAVFNQNGIEYEAEFSQNGQWLETEYEVSDAQFPATLLQKIQLDYPGYQITKREIELTPQGIFYEVEVEQGGAQIELYFDERANPANNSNEDA
ncbi:PepSY-like domain-containing protein [Limnofasciculus baicalensis]|uniref:PepSY-like domain-containing protein n=1 Tax=Limnofasciculus baicalensis BBK-W-15 TaxID=2699891 RepID=A0AAE3KLF9_9CYAN|nr:PepSY-like domain-containing protein [Limnofasciculus baicalensis]MCP2728024.1 PepSY-like domain-containing protein [Limnofasciculus baicalensis BBK-W-15]